MITCTSRARILKLKTVFLGPLKFSKNMLSKSILIGSFVLNNNKTIEEPKGLHGGYIVEKAFFTAGYMAHTGIWGWFSHSRLWPAEASIG